MNTAVMGRKTRRNVSRRMDLRRPVAKAEVVGGVVCALGCAVGRILRWTAAVAFVAGVSVAILLAYRWVTTHEFFCLKELDVRGEQRFSDADIAAMGGVGLGCNVLGVNIAAVQSRIAASPWVEDVSVTRVLPNGLIIEVQEREPVFFIRRNAELYYADADGNSIAPVVAENFVSLPVLEKDEGVPMGQGVRGLLEEIKRNALPFGMRDIAWVRQDSAEQFSLFLEYPRALVQVDGADLNATLGCIAKLWVDLERRGELEQVASLFVMPGRAWVRLKTTQTF